LTKDTTNSEKSVHDKDMFEKKYESRFSDIDKNRCFKTGAVMNLLQDISFAHATYAGIDEERLCEYGTALLLSGWRVKFLNKLLDAEVVVKTGIMNVGRCEAARKYEIHQDGECKVIATGIWFAVNTSIRKVSRIPEAYVSAFESVSEEDNGIPFDRILPEKDTVHLGEFSVEARDIDANNHFNNVKSIEKFLEYLPEDCELNELCVKYRKEVKVGETVSVRGKQLEKGFYLEFRNADDAVCTFAYVKK